MSKLISSLCGKDDFTARRMTVVGRVMDSARRVRGARRYVRDGFLDRFRKKDVDPIHGRKGTFEDFVKGIKGMFDVKKTQDGDQDIITAKWTSSMDLGALLDLRFDFWEISSNPRDVKEYNSYKLTVTVLNGEGRGEHYILSFDNIEDCWNWMELHWADQSHRDDILEEVKKKATGTGVSGRRDPRKVVRDSFLHRRVVRDSHRRVVRDTAMRLRRVQDSVSVEELRRFAKDHTDWKLSKEEIRYYFDARSYAVISADKEDASYKVQFRGFSQSKDDEVVRRYTNLERAAKFAYARGNDMMGDGSKGEGSSRIDEKTEDSVRRRVIRDSHRVIRACRVKDAEDFNGGILEVIRRAVKAGFKPDESQSVAKVGEAATRFLKEKESESGAAADKVEKEQSSTRGVRDSRYVVRDSRVRRVVRR